MVDVYLDEKYIGKVDEPLAFVSRVRKERRSSRVSHLLNIMYDKHLDEVHIITDSGRARRPLIIVEDGKPKLTKSHIIQLSKQEITWDHLIEQGVIEYLDAAEEENCLVAMSEEELTKEHTHLEISSISILGFCTSLVPYANHGSSARLNRGSKTQKQSIGIYATNFPLRVDTDVSILHYPQVPITKSFTNDILQYEKHPSGQNITIAVMSYGGYNMQDSIILNQGSVERGLARSTFFRPYISEELKYSGGLTDEIAIPDKSVKGYRSEQDYKSLEKDGIVYTEAKVKADDVIIGKTSPPRFLGELEEFSIAASTRRENSVAIRHGEGGIVDMIILTENEEGNRL